MEKSLASICKISKNNLNLWKILDFLYPPFCVTCGKFGEEFCENCIGLIKKINQNQICPVCGDFSNNGEICSDCSENPPAFNQLRSWGIYEGNLREALHSLKFHNVQGIARHFFNECANFILGWDIQVDCIVPVPLSKKRLRDRGYNQSELLARGIAKKIDIQFSSQILRRVRETHTQVGLNLTQRKENVQNAFSCDINKVQGKSFLVIDDITTTGSTLSECSHALKSMGAIKVFCFTIARTPLEKNLSKEMEEIWARK